jgi:hypothetical protein
MFTSRWCMGRVLLRACGGEVDVRVRHAVGPRGAEESQRRVLRGADNRGRRVPQSARRSAVWRRCDPGPAGYWLCGAASWCGADFGPGPSAWLCESAGAPAPWGLHRARRLRRAECRESSHSRRNPPRSLAGGDHAPAERTDESGSASRALPGLVLRLHKRNGHKPLFVRACGTHRVSSSTLA